MSDEEIIPWTESSLIHWTESLWFKEWLKLARDKKQYYELNKFYVKVLDYTFVDSMQKNKD